jgi:NAD(P)-dependent dehydrogenase (short-subunit alcohol dehydrogenase family)
MWAATEEAARGSAIERQARHRDRWQPGIGKAIARQLAEEGVEVVIAARGREQLEATAAEITKAAGCRVSRLSPTWETDAAAWTDQLLSAPLETNTNLPRFTS